MFSTHSMKRNVKNNLNQEKQNFLQIKCATERDCYEYLYDQLLNMSSRNGFCIEFKGTTDQRSPL